MTIIKEKEQHKNETITNREVTTDPIVDVKAEIKHALAVLYSRVREAPLS